MDDLQAAVTLATNLKPAVNLAQALLDLIGSGKGKREAVELYGQIYAAHQSALAAQVAQSALLKEKQELEQQLASLKNWESEKQRYQLTDIDGTAFVFAHKPGMEGDEPPHWLCEKCFRDGHAETLQLKGFIEQMGMQGLRARWRCNDCGGEILVSRSRRPSGGVGA